MKKFIYIGLISGIIVGSILLFKSDIRFIPKIIYLEIIAVSLSVALSIIVYFILEKIGILKKPSFNLNNQNVINKNNYFLKIFKFIILGFLIIYLVIYILGFLIGLFYNGGI
ncbi:MAG: hypothetical protein UR85_C0003G0058 [Candidatus Nomurabacteria bacterium GW2011_GWF2_35_66]|uniref:Uncharacterized protein n=1 Tax=Candidatus Nomurabacteria bacterium GW2011_GWE1_35_16 TaxID=1618761 RepID=A0A0G0EH35_9BACT|nr:MAG: hypothetical protein UR55_C0005G0057 [Candidatus Nomurabacteria bacterium GW2011_GWF1_34_20]KKP63385.1 MAG: hypothetical protein UR57_C0005G0057 [Candidatus Nomurabacteria bacterium GW2011_GWE2_34_25]KKP66577.1 MAG: hypothetical protein UR64_C0005G0039 [Candidatus Nomurabacteria bacterium GW2011_GWE1_35_16]KKP83623.1 MAG: hypothetical protein UR85_C0003G0058 [Candidatus Nomurabacteria bacterium GW2011_GWF2_35_66]HAE36883.1 hypothetical protein [Candidatus Nomurabacteria bacterium]